VKSFIPTLLHVPLILRVDERRLRLEPASSPKKTATRAEALASRTKAANGRFSLCSMASMGHDAEAHEELLFGIELDLPKAARREQLQSRLN
jgi:hypothetical protein